jgi:CRISPR-associated endonuclease/helicase Cas3
MTYDDFFQRCAGTRRYDWQARLAGNQTCRNQLIRIPTGFGKTAGVTLAWLWNRVEQKNDAWPRRLVLCLPMRTLVEQTKRAVSDWLERAGLNPEERVHVLMGGLSQSEWHLQPDREIVLIGTQDMLLSRALNRGYGSGRARWPMEQALLNVDSLWVMDEIQLMDVGLATSAQLQGFADADDLEDKLPRPRRTWWMSATLQRDWLRRAPGLPNVEELPLLQLEPSEKVGPLWAVAKSARIERVPSTSDAKAERWADLVVAAHNASPSGRGVTLAIANTVKNAIDLHRGLEQRKKRGGLPADVDLRLVHSRFRGTERRQWATEFLSREQCGADQNRIIVATQVVEAGVDISADVLVTELAPWASLVQRFGRCARYGGEGRITIVDRRHSDDSATQIKAKDEAERNDKRRHADLLTVLPYDLEDIEAAAEGLSCLDAQAGPAALEDFETAQEQQHGRGLLPRLFPYEPRHVLSRRELRDLFDTGPDLTGADIDISRFIREGDERDVSVWWWPVPEGESPHSRLRPEHDALCRVAIKDAREWLVSNHEAGDDEHAFTEERTGGAKAARLRAWVWSYLDGEWERAERRHIYPGQTFLVDACAGGYDEKIGFTGRPGRISVVAKHARGVGAAEAADASDEQDELSEGLGQSNRQYKTIATHGWEVAEEAQRLARSLGLLSGATHLLKLAGLAHDIGKAHPAFAGAIKDRNGIGLETHLAKAPKGRWHGGRGLYDKSSLGKRPGFRHELASALALLELTWRARPDHPALQGGREQLMDITVGRELPERADRIGPAFGFVAELMALDATSFNLIAYLVLCHHGKVRATLTMGPHDQDHPAIDATLPIRGVCDGDRLPRLVAADVDGLDCELPEVILRLDVAKLGLSCRYGPSWVERVLDLRMHYGDLQLVWLETLLRVADVRASQIASPRDARLPQDLVEVASIHDGNATESELQRWVDETLASAAASERGAATQARKTTKSSPSLKPLRSAAKQRSSKPPGSRGGKQ